MILTLQLGYQGEGSFRYCFADNPHLNDYVDSFGDFHPGLSVLSPSPDLASNPHSSWYLGMTVKFDSGHLDCSTD